MVDNGGTAAIGGGSRRRSAAAKVRAPLDRRRTARLSIPLRTETAAEFKERLGSLIASPDTHVYVDTSFLMWATKIGTASRREVLAWLRAELAGRVHVPTWAGHEYLRHHVAGTIVKELKERSKEVSSLAGKTFNYFRPFLDDPAVGFDEASEELRSSTRNAVNMLGRLVAAAAKWERSYPVHASEVIGFINDTALTVGELYGRIAAISSEGSARYEGRIPPGFRDAGKKGEVDPDDADGEHDQAMPGANRFGDLLFWKEVLSDAAERGALAAIVLTNDRKNDWRMGGETSPDLDDAMLADRKSWRPVPRVHPMLALEAQAAGIGEVTLLDSQYLAAFLRDTAADVAAFADVAIVPGPPPPPTESEAREQALARRRADDYATQAIDAAARAHDAVAHGHLFADDPLVKTGTAALGKALMASRRPEGSRIEDLLQRLRADVSGSDDVRHVLSGEALAGLDHCALASLSRALHDRAVDGVPGHDEALADLVALLDELPPRTAGALTLGLLASMFLEADTGTARIPPSSPVAGLLLRRLAREEAAVAVETIRRRLLGNQRMPVVVPDTTTRQLDVRFDIEPHTMEEDELRSLKVEGVELLVAVQSDPALRLRDLIAGETATRSRLLRRAAEIYALPVDRLPSEDGEDRFALTPDIGFRRPSTVFRSKDMENG